ncbi:MAG TPA: YceI family protein [Burkholderiales bacterium]|jgi:polyisoprenoid-binding protein YceI|nr:YceI family protein [Burkholderiales bacterium]
MHRAAVAASFAAALSTTALAAPESYTVDPAHTYPGFEINHLGFSNMRGTFDSTRGRIVLDRTAGTGSIEIVIDTASIDTGHAKRDEHLRAEDFFNVAVFPAMSYKSTRLTFEGDRLAGVDGELTLLGKTLPVSLTITNFNCGQNPINKKHVCGANAVTTLKRSQFGMTAYLPGIGDEVRITIGIEAVRD